MDILGNLFSKPTSVTPDMDQALQVLHNNANPQDPEGTIIWMNVDRDGNASYSNKEIPTEVFELNGEIVERFTYVADEVVVQALRFDGNNDAVLVDINNHGKIMPLSEVDDYIEKHLGAMYDFDPGVP